MLNERIENSPIKPPSSKVLRKGALLAANLLLIACAQSIDTPHTPPKVLPTFGPVAPTATPSPECEMNPIPVIDQSPTNAKLEVFSKTGAPTPETGKLRFTLKETPERGDWKKELNDIGKDPYRMIFGFDNIKGTPLRIGVTMGVLNQRKPHLQLSFQGDVIDRDKDHTIEICWIDWRVKETLFDGKSKVPFIIMPQEIPNPIKPIL